MIAKPIYTPQGRANEYCQYAINIYTGCNHGCAYCWARSMKKRFCGTSKAFTFDSPAPRHEIVESVKRQIEREQISGRLIHLCFSCDPYPAEIDTTPTREIIKLIKDAGNNVQILTKGGSRAERDFDLLGAGDWFGVTYTGGYPGVEAVEPKAAGVAERLNSIALAWKNGINTWVSCEPVITPQHIYSLIAQYDYINLFRIGKMNHFTSSINWGEFGRECERLCKKYGRNYYIKEDLRKEMGGDVN